MTVIFDYLKISEYVQPFAQFVNATSVGNITGVTSFDINTPTGAQDGDTLILAVCAGANTVSTPSGWTLLQDQLISATASHSYVFGLTISGTPPSSYTVTQGASMASVAAMVCYRSAAIDTSAESPNAASTNITAPALTVTAPKTLVCVFARDDSNTAITVPGSMTERVSVAGFDAAGSRKVIISDEQISTSGSTGTRVATGTVSLASYGVSIAL